MQIRLVLVSENAIELSLLKALVDLELVFEWQMVCSLLKTNSGQQ